jgi:hypothetical protein
MLNVLARSNSNPFEHLLYLFVLGFSFGTVTTGPLERSNCRIYFRGQYWSMDRRLFHAGVTLERVDWVSPLNARCLEEQHRLFVQLAFTKPQFFFFSRRSGEEWTKRTRLQRKRNWTNFGRRYLLVVTKRWTNGARSLADHEEDAPHGHKCPKMALTVK